MVQSRGGAGFAAKTLQCLRVVSNIVRQELQGDQASQRDVLGLINDTHSTAAQLIQDAVMRDGLADDGGASMHSPAMLGGMVDQVNGAAASGVNLEERREIGKIACGLFTASEKRYGF